MYSSVAEQQEYGDSYRRTAGHWFESSCTTNNLAVVLKFNNYEKILEYQKRFCKKQKRLRVELVNI